MSRTRKRIKPRPGKTPQVNVRRRKPAPVGDVQVRMYDVDFGDCFLIRFDAKGEPEYVLVDCGVLQGRHSDLLQNAFADIAKVTGRKLALVVASHQHYDHISGFGMFADQFADFDVGALWLPWLDNPKDPKAAEWQRKQQALTMALQNHYMRLDADADTAAVLQILYNNSGGPSMAAGATVLGKAIDLLRSGFRGKVEPGYLRNGKDAPALPGPLRGLLRTTVLGPPDTDEFLRDLDPPSEQGWQQLAAAAAGLPPDAKISPFPGALVPETVWEDILGRTQIEEIRSALAEASPDDLETAVASIDASRNNTSLVLLFEFNGKRMLFPGDAQWGNWERWLYGSVDAANAGSLQSDSKQELAGLHFYKVGHHGSHNATPRGALEAMPKGRFAAMCSTRADVPKYPHIPMPSLMTALEGQTAKQLVRSDELEGALPKGFTKGDGWVELTL